MKDIEQAVRLLKAGGLVGLPTETVYGLAADARNEKAIRRLFSVKHRPANHPLIVHIGAHEALDPWITDCPAGAQRLMDAFWPGPLTLILPKHPSVSDVITGGQSTIGLRCPRHPIAQAVLSGFGGGLVAPSANRFGRISPTTADHVHQGLGDDVDLVLEGGPCEVGIESTIIDYSTGSPVLLRPGQLSIEAIESVCHQTIAMPSGDSPRASGTLPGHYAPHTPLVAANLEEIAQQANHAARQVSQAAMVLSPGVFSSETFESVQMPADPQAYGQQLYETLHRLDQKNLAQIFIELPPTTAAWAAINDRLKRAIRGSGLAE